MLVAVVVDWRLHRTLGRASTRPNRGFARPVAWCARCSTACIMSTNALPEPDRGSAVPQPVGGDYVKARHLRGTPSCVMESGAGAATVRSGAVHASSGRRRRPETVAPFPAPARQPGPMILRHPVFRPAVRRRREARAPGSTQQARPSAIDPRPGARPRSPPRRWGSRSRSGHGRSRLASVRSAGSLSCGAVVDAAHLRADRDTADYGGRVPELDRRCKSGTT